MDKKMTEKEVLEWLRQNAPRLPRCPNCGAVLQTRKIDHWSHDHSYKTGYTAEQWCDACFYFDTYTDIE